MVAFFYYITDTSRKQKLFGFLFKLFLNRRLSRRLPNSMWFLYMFRFIKHHITIVEIKNKVVSGILSSILSSEDMS